jgi:hypothetical protein
MLKSRKTVRVLVRYGSRLNKTISVKTVKLKHLNRGRVRAFREKSRKTVKKVRYAVLGLNCPSWKTVR